MDVVNHIRAPEQIIDEVSECLSEAQRLLMVLNLKTHDQDYLVSKLHSDLLRLQNNLTEIKEAFENGTGKI